MDYMIIVLATPQAINTYIKGHGAPAEGARFEGGLGLFQGSDEIIPPTTRLGLRGGGRAIISARATDTIVAIDPLGRRGGTAEGTRSGHGHSSSGIARRARISA